MKRKVFGVGLGKTGTTTLGACLKTLGYKVTGCDVNLTRHLRQGNWAPLYRVADRYNGFEDFPWPLTYKKMDERYDECKFILTVRKDSETWFKSLLKHADKTGPTEHKKLAYGYKLPYGLKEEHISFYEQHNREVKQYFQDRDKKLLVVCWETGDGWKKICNFLGHSIPGEPFPHSNKALSKPERYWWIFRNKTEKLFKSLTG